MSAIRNTHGIKILVVDDDSSIGRLLGDFLRVEGYHPLICSHPREALDFSKYENFGLAFVDINLPDMSGLELASKLKEQHPLSEVIFITGHGSFDNAIQAIKIGAYDYLRKPFGINELKFCLKRFQERQDLKEQIELTEQRYFHLVQNVPSLVFVIRKDFHIEFINRACETMLGYTPDEVFEDPGWLLGRIHSRDFERIKRLFLSIFQTSSSRFSAECRLIHRDGHLIHAMIGAIALIKTEKDVEIERLQGMIVDITDRVFMERSVVQKEKLRILGSISAEVAHEIRNPLVSIGGFARRLRKRFPELAEGDIILRESERLEKLLKRIADYLKPVVVHYQECSINEMVAGCVEQFASETQGENRPCRLNLDSSLSIISIDRDILSQIFIDLMRNAAKELKEGGDIYIRTFESEKNLHIEFKNRCQRKKAKDSEPFFMPFSGGNQDIGLPLSYRLLKKMGGLLSFSQIENETVFTVSLPKRATPISDIDGVIAP